MYRQDRAYQDYAYIPIPTSFLYMHLVAIAQVVEH